ncbi:MAG: hypothetical protein RQ733_10075 [Methyloprofundus sp.]|nr:hypothetical protein [Methyloprofundus sp.]MDT8426308.1 hypothetical protein [Methyloprofundus sp.]
MNKLEINQTSSTFKLGPLIIASALSGIPTTNKIAQNSLPNNSIDAYASNSSSSTFSEHLKLQKNSIDYTFNKNTFEQVASDFYSELQKKQEPLEQDFEIVLYDNLWNLYES